MQGMSGLERERERERERVKSVRGRVLRKNRLKHWSKILPLVEFLNDLLPEQNIS